MRESGIQPREVGTTSYSVILESAGPKGPNVLDVIDALQEIIGEDDAWKLMRNIPSAFVHNLSMSDAERIKAKFEALGASARIMPTSE